MTINNGQQGDSRHYVRDQPHDGGAETAHENTIDRLHLVLSTQRQESSTPDLPSSKDDLPRRTRNKDGRSEHTDEHASRAHASTFEPIAICGLAMRLPAGIRNTDQLFDLIRQKQSATSRVPKERYNVDAYHQSGSRVGTQPTDRGHFLDDLDYADFDTTMFSMIPAEVAQADPAQRLLLEVVREAFENAGEIDWRGKDIGSYVGSFTEDWQHMQNLEVINHNQHILGRLDLALSNRIAYEYDLKGPSMTIKTGCSASGVALHEAAMSIQTGQIKSAIVAGANLIHVPGMTVGMGQTGTLAPDGSSKSFDASANGYGRGEAVIALYIKRLNQAVQDGNPIRAIIRGTATNSDGRTNGMPTPNPESQKAVIRQAYRNAGLPLTQTALIEAHGTGTLTGDPLEASAIAECFGAGGIYMTSVKANLGHSEGVAALTSIAKAITSLEHRQILPQIKFRQPNPSIPWNNNKLIVPTEITKWPEKKAERISINSYGIGGANSHTIIDSAASFGLGYVEQHGLPRDISHRLLVFSANHKEALQKIATNHVSYAESHPDRLNSLSYTLLDRRDHLKLRTFSVMDHGIYVPSTTTAKAGSKRGAAFVFTGQGAQWVHMGQKLIEESAIFLQSIEVCNKGLQNLPHPPSWSIVSVLRDVGDKAIIAQPEFAQPICTAVQIALVDLLDTWGVHPTAVVGHSSGEIAAAYAAGVLTKAEAMTVAYYRGYICRDYQRQGGMAAVGTSREQVLRYLTDNVQLACENSPASVTLSGDIEPLENALTAIKIAQPDVLARRLQVSMAYHSHHMTELAEQYHDLIAPHLRPQKPAARFYSSGKVKILDQAIDFGASHWVQNLESRVQFYPAVSELLSDLPDLVHLEVGPHSALAGPLRQIYQQAGKKVDYVATLSRGKDDTVSFLQTVGTLFSLGVNVRFPKTNPKPYVLTDLPTYPWHYETKFWSDSRTMRNWRFRRHLPHDLLGVQTLDCSDLTPTWRHVLCLGSVPWLRDHCIGSDVVLPAAAYIAMAGEGMFQISGQRPYTIRDAHLTQALVLNADKDVELITTMRPKRLTSSLDSEWYEFSVMSLTGSSWNKHFTSLVKPGAASKVRPKTATFERKVSSARWYDAMARAGLCYGPRFSGMRDITASVTSRQSSAIIEDEQYDTESYYAMHPATMDKILHLFTIAAHQGLCHKLEHCFVPTYFQEICVGDVRGQRIGFHSTAIGPAETLQGHTCGVLDGETAAYIKGFRATAVDIEKPTQHKPPSALQLEWKPHVDLVASQDYVAPVYSNDVELGALERLYVLCLLESETVIMAASPTSTIHKRYLRWALNELQEIRMGNYTIVSETTQVADMTSPERQNLIDQIMQDSKDRRSAPLAQAISRTYKRLPEILSGDIDQRDSLLTDDILYHVFHWFDDIFDLSTYTQLLGHTFPQMNILEIGGGSGHLSVKILSHLTTAKGERLYNKYTYSDISSDAFVQAQDRLKLHDAVEFRVLDISRDPLEQGFAPGGFDLIVAANVLHATPDLKASLSHIRSLLSPDGKLLLQEATPKARFMGFVMGLMPGWWLGQADNRTNGAFTTLSDWQARLQEAGFDYDRAVQDGQELYNSGFSMIAYTHWEHEGHKTIVTILSHEETHILAQPLQDLLHDGGAEVHLQNWREDIPPSSSIISLVDLSKVLLQDISKGDLKRLLALVSARAEGEVILWLTPSAQINPDNPDAAQIIGLARTIRSELSVAFATLELFTCDRFNIGQTVTSVMSVFNHLMASRSNVSSLDPDWEYALLYNRIQVPRFHWTPVSRAILDSAPTAYNAKSLHIGTRGLLQTLQWRGTDLPKLRDDHVQVRIRAVGLNFADTLIAMGVINSSEALGDGWNALGLEGSGVITAVGDNHQGDLQVGHRVMVLGNNSAGFATEIQRPAAYCVRIADSVSDVEAASMPVVYGTVLVALTEKVRTRPGQSILIHAAAGGIGIAAVYVARWLGLEIYATVGTDAKRAYVVEELGLHDARVFHSRDESFVDGVMEATCGKGVDYVLNSVSGELLHATWSCIAYGGTMLELGKRDFAGMGQLQMAPFVENRSFIGVDLSRMQVFDQEMVSRVMLKMGELLQAGHIKPIHPITEFSANKVEDAFRYMQKGQHLGKIVIRFDDSVNLSVTPSTPKPGFRSDRSYLLVGGTGGLGQAIARWMVEHGARHLAFMSRLVGKRQSDLDLFAELEAMGCKTTPLACDVSNSAAVLQAIKQVQPPVTGALQMAMVLKDTPVLDMDLETWQMAVKPKVQGTWNLHNALPADLDFFVMFSSTSGLVGQYGQSNYAAANTFLDSFAQFRQQQGLAASVINVRPVSDIGYISTRSRLLDDMSATMGEMMTEKDLLETLHLAILRSKPTASITANKRVGGFSAPSQIGQLFEGWLPISHPDNNLIWKRDARMAIFKNIQIVADETTGGAKDADDILGTFLRSIMTDARKLDGKDALDLLANEIGKKVSTFLNGQAEEVNTSLSLTAAGVDSLVGIELRNWWRTNLGVDVSQLELMNGGSMVELARLAVDRLKVKCHKTESGN
ncbi:KR domain-containing protein [Elsinoe fawcettii]|nr:KR domain-containing protein [Elsinoe fawcettii]